MLLVGISMLKQVKKNKKRSKVKHNCLLLLTECCSKSVDAEATRGKVGSGYWSKKAGPEGTLVKVRNVKSSAITNL